MADLQHTEFNTTIFPAVAPYERLAVKFSQHGRGRSEKFLRGEFSTQSKRKAAAAGA
jgi:hypothetical protein